MRLKSFKVTNYRSIKSTFEISVQHNLTIVGPNNEGKSNLVRALVTSLQLLEELTKNARRAGIARMPIDGRHRYRSQIYQWDTDYPIDGQNKSTGTTKFKLQFLLDEVDQREFQRTIGSSINDNLPITITIGQTQIPRFEVNKPGKGFASLTSKSSEIAAFIGSKLSVNYIPAVRTARDSAGSVERLVSSALRKIENTSQYTTALKTIEDLQRPVLKEIEDRLKDALTTFVPSVRDISLHIRERRSDLLRSVEIGIDDGQMTPLRNKGDGVISLVGMALLSRIDSLAVSGLNLVLVIEEPESHLHPKAIHSIRSTLDNLGNEIQVIITTHSPNLVNKSDIGGNIIVEQNVARVAKSISEIRDILGVRVSDNLTNSRLTVICEGENDRTSLPGIISALRPDLSKHISSNEISFLSLGGGGSLSYCVNSIQNAICEPVCLLDDDDAGRTAFQGALSDGLLSEDDVVFTSRLGKEDSEFEDLIRDDLIEAILSDIFSVTTTAMPPNIKGLKFSERVRFQFKASGRVWNDNVKMACKAEVRKKCTELGLDAIDPNRRAPFESLAKLVADRLGSQS